MPSPVQAGIISIPIPIWRPSAARETLGFRPLVQAGWADASSIERIPRVTALAEPLVFLAGRPAAEPSNANTLI